MKDKKKIIVAFAEVMKMTRNYSDMVSLEYVQEGGEEFAVATFESGGWKEKSMCHWRLRMGVLIGYFKTNLKGGGMKHKRPKRPTRKLLMQFKEKLVHCTHCNNLICRADKYCQYSGKPTETKKYKVSRNGAEVPSSGDGNLRPDEGKPKAIISVPCETWRRAHRPESAWLLNRFWVVFLGEKLQTWYRTARDEVKVVKRPREPPKRRKNMKHKRPRRPTRKQKEHIVAAGYKPENWLVLDVDNISMTIVSKESGRKRVILC